MAERREVAPRPKREWWSLFQTARELQLFLQWEVDPACEREKGVKVVLTSIVKIASASILIEPAAQDKLLGIAPPRQLAVASEMAMIRRRGAEVPTGCKAGEDAGGLGSALTDFADVGPPRTKARAVVA